MTPILEFRDLARSFKRNVPVLNGVLAVERHQDAQSRAGGAHGNKGEEVALAALEIVDLWSSIATAMRG